LKIEVIGVYLVEAPEPVHLVELRIRECTRHLDVGEITQQVVGQPKANWQAPWDERFLNADGTAVLNPARPDKVPEDSELRLVFFFHYLDQEQPFLTPAGPVGVPTPKERPARLGFAEYESPC